MTAPRRTRLAATRLYLVASAPAAPAAGPLGDRTRHALPVPAPLAAALVAAAGAGVGAVQWRAKRATTAERRAALACLREWLPPGTLLIVNDDLEAVFDADGLPLADGVHLGREDAAALGATGRTPRPAVDSPDDIARGLALARLRLGPGLLLGTSTRTLEEVTRARAAGADHVGFGAMAPTGTKSGTVRAEPGELHRVLVAHPDLPVFPIGGLGPDTLGLVTAVGATRAAIGAAILDAADPAAAVARCLERLGAAVRHGSWDNPGA